MRPYVSLTITRSMMALINARFAVRSPYLPSSVVRIDFFVMVSRSEEAMIWVMSRSIGCQHCSKSAVTHDQLTQFSLRGTFADRMF